MTAKYKVFPDFPDHQTKPNPWGGSGANPHNATGIFDMVYWYTLLTLVESQAIY
jgi:hypothetical protein